MFNKASLLSSKATMLIFFYILASIVTLIAFVVTLNSIFLYAYVISNLLQNSIYGRCQKALDILGFNILENSDTHNIKDMRLYIVKLRRDEEFQSKLVSFIPFWNGNTHRDLDLKFKKGLKLTEEEN